MALSMLTNVSSLGAQRNLAKTNNAVAKNISKLSSGMRINRSADDAAGLAITSKMSAHIRGLSQAERNSNDAVSLIQTAEGALNEINGLLTRMRELAVQSANATNSASDRQALNDEVEQRIAEIDRIATQTAFNGLKVLDGTFGEQNFQVGANAGETIGIDLTQGARKDQIGAIASKELNIAGAIDTTNTLSIKVGDGDFVAVGASEDTSATAGSGYEADSAFAIAEAIKAAEVDGLFVTVSTEKTFTGGVAAAGTGILSINGVDVYDGGGSATNDDFIAAVNSTSGSTGVTAELAENGTDVVLKAADGRSINFGGAGLDSYSLTEDNSRAV